MSRVSTIQNIGNQFPIFKSLSCDDSRIAEIVSFETRNEHRLLGTSDQVSDVALGDPFGPGDVSEGAGPAYDV